MTTASIVTYRCQQPLVFELAVPEQRRGECQMYRCVADTEADDDAKYQVEIISQQQLHCSVIRAEERCTPFRLYCFRSPSV